MHMAINRAGIRAFSSLISHRVSLLCPLGSSSFSTEEYAKRNYANNLSEYNTVVASVTAQRRYYLLRDVYDDMMLDGVQPSRDVFQSFIVGSMKGSRLQDALFFTDEMKVTGLVPDVVLYNFLISTCGKCKHSHQAVNILEDMRKNEVKPTGQTYICLLNSLAACGRLDRVYTIVRDMTAAGLGLNKFCYAGLIAAHKNKVPVPEDATSKIIELVEQSRGWSSIDTPGDTAENVMMDVSEEELYHLPTAEYINRPGGFVARHLTVYHVAFHAFADLKNVQGIETLTEMLKRDRRTPDVFIIIQTMRCYLHSGDIDNGLKVFQDYLNSGKPPSSELFVTMVEGSMVGYTPRGMQLAQDTLVKMNSRGFYLSPKSGNELLIVAAGEKTGGYATANFIWDLMRARNIFPSLPAVEAYYHGLKGREIPETDLRLQDVSKAYDSVRFRGRQ